MTYLADFSIKINCIATAISFSITYYKIWWLLGQKKKKEMNPWDSWDMLTSSQFNLGCYMWDFRYSCQFSHPINNSNSWWVLNKLHLYPEFSGKVFVSIPFCILNKLIAALKSNCVLRTIPPQGVAPSESAFLQWIPSLCELTTGNVAVVRCQKVMISLLNAFLRFSLL